MSKTKHLLRALPLALLVAGASCADPGERDADWEFIHAAIIAPSCATASCHSSLSKTAGVDLENSSQAYEFLLEQNFVVPFDTGSNILFLLNGVERPLMPPDGPLPKADVDLVRTWIEEGALR